MDKESEEHVDYHVVLRRYYYHGAMTNTPPQTELARAKMATTALPYHHSTITQYNKPE